MSEKTNIHTDEDVEVNQSNENDETESTETRKTPTNDFKVIQNMIKEIDEWNKTLKDETHNILKDVYGLNNFSMVGIIPYDNEKLNNVTKEEANKFFEKYHDKSCMKPRTFESDDDAIQTMKEVKDLQMSLYSAEKDTEKLKADSQDIINDYLNYLSSPEIIAARKKRLETMKSLADVETDVLKKNQMMRLIDTMENTMTLEFIFNRFKSCGDKEINSVMKSFFSPNLGNTIINKYKSKVSKFGFNPDLYKYFFNLEENFLDENYHVFNNLFLFYYMRFVAHSDPYNKKDTMYVQSLTSAITNLIYHKFTSTTEEQTFIHIIEKIDDMFMDKYDYFFNNNTMHPKHPVRIESSAKYEADRKAMLIGKMDELGITGYNTESTADELQKFFNDNLDEMLEAQRKERTEEKSNVNVSEGDNGEIVIEPIVEETINMVSEEV